MKRAKASLSILALTAANLVPLGGVLYFGWDVISVVVLYWTENVVVGFYNVLKLALVKAGGEQPWLDKLGAIIFFCGHFGIFCAVHGILLLVIFNMGGGIEALLSDEAQQSMLATLLLPITAVARFWHVRPPGLGLPILALVVSHGVSFIYNFCLEGEYARLTIDELVLQPYRRMLLLHAAIIAGGIPVVAFGSPPLLLVILVGLKIGLDIWLHIKSHRAVPPGKGGHVRRGKVEPADSQDV